MWTRLGGFGMAKFDLGWNSQPNTNLGWIRAEILTQTNLT